MICVTVTTVIKKPSRRVNSEEHGGNGYRKKPINSNPGRLKIKKLKKKIKKCNCKTIFN